MKPSHACGRIVTHDGAVSIISKFTFLSIAMMVVGFVGGLLGFERTFGPVFILGIPGTIGGLGALLVVAPMAGFKDVPLWEKIANTVVMLAGAAAVAVSVGAFAAVAQRTF